MFPARALACLLPIYTIQGGSNLSPTTPKASARRQPPRQPPNLVDRFLHPRQGDSRRLRHLDGYGTTDVDTLSQAVALPSTCTNYQFSFWLHIDTAETSTTTAYDTLTVQVLNSSGTVLGTLATYSNLNHITGYAQHTFSLAAYAGQTVTLKFTGSEDYTKQTSFVLDDTAVNVS